MTTITRRTRSLGYGYTAQTEQTPGGLGVREPKITQRGLTPRQLLTAHNEAKRLYSGGTDWRFAVAVDGNVLSDPRGVMDELRLLVEGLADTVSV